MGPTTRANYQGDCSQNGRAAGRSCSPGAARAAIAKRCAEGSIAGLRRPVMNDDSTKKQKGDLLEQIIERLCAGIKDARVSRNARVLGKKSDTQREIDVWI